MCDVDETLLQPVFVGYKSPTAKANDWVGAHVEFSPPQAARPIPDMACNHLIFTCILLFHHQRAHMCARANAHTLFFLSSN